MEAMEKEQSGARPAVVAALEHLTGPERGTVTWLSGSTVDLSLSPGRIFHVTEPGAGDPGDTLAARFHRAGNSYEIETPEGQLLWVNRVRIDASRLKHNDIIEFGETGPLSHFRLYGDGIAKRRTVADIMCDCVDYLQVSRQPIAKRVYSAVSVLLWELTLETTVLFRISVLVAIGFLAALAYQQNRLSIRLEQIVESGEARLDSVAAALVRTELAVDEYDQGRSAAARRPDRAAG